MESRMLCSIFVAALLFFAAAEARFPTPSRKLAPGHLLPRRTSASSFVSITDLPDDESKVRAATSVPSQTASKHVSYAAYATLNKTIDANMFFWFFEAESGDPEAPIIIWLQGGPGCGSVGMGNLIETGPYTMSSDGKITDNPYSWNKDAHMLYIDQPIGSGFSFVSDDKYLVTTESELADQLFNFLTQFFTKYASLQKSELYVFGESYAGKYIPAICYRIIKASSSEMHINLKGMGIGDGLTDPINQLPHYASVGHAFGLIDHETMLQYQKVEQQGIEFIKEKKWSNATGAFDIVWSGIEAAGGVNCYDVRMHTGYNFDYVNNWLNTQATKDLLHAGEYKYDECYGPAMNALNDDMMQSIAHHFRTFLADDSPVRVLLYNGQWDFIITSEGAEAWMSTIEWPHRAEWVEKSKSVWHGPEDPTAGWVKKLTYIVVANSGHMVPMNQPENALDMVQRFITSKPF